jgi:hypothetical protein
MEIPVAIRTMAKTKKDERYKSMKPTRMEVGLMRGVMATRDQSRH